MCDGFLLHPQQTPVAWVPDAGVRGFRFPKAEKALFPVLPNVVLACLGNDRRATDFIRNYFQKILPQAASFDCKLMQLNMHECLLVPSDLTFIDFCTNCPDF